VKFFTASVIRCITLLKLILGMCAN